ncbi:uncharacterized protein TrAtP1_012511 [Trichoderma atroviride]|uniref:uncharacterized protein n=1 Tax=Hypocrea atroviridis TaxID=63577 RepID=UPI003318A3A7|nr:hypothetical protein TrAtP1_012511 [Trichoderma atroviride]
MSDIKAKASHDIENQHLRPPVADDAYDESRVPREDSTFKGLGPARLVNPRQQGLSRLFHVLHDSKQQIGYRMSRLLFPFYRRLSF